MTPARVRPADDANDEHFFRRTGDADGQTMEDFLQDEEDDWHDDWAARDDYGPRS
jgi:hypothetical protein